MNNNSVEFVKQLTLDDNIGNEISLILDYQLNQLCYSISKVNEFIEKDDCKQYILSTIKEGRSFKELSHLYVYCKHRLIDMYRREKRQKEIETEFSNYYFFISEVFEVDYDTLFCLLISINPKFQIYISNDKFITGKNRKLNYSKINTVYNKFVIDYKLDVNPTASSICRFLQESYIERKYDTINVEQIYVEFDDRRGYSNNYKNNDDLEFDDDGNIKDDLGFDDEYYLD